VDGRPDPARLLNAADLFLIPFTLLWGGFAVAFFIQGVTGRMRADASTVLVGSLFALVGLYLIAGRFVVKAYRKRRTSYAVRTAASSS
jgi:predicted transporter